MKRNNLVICTILVVVILLSGCASETITVTEKSITTPTVIVTPTVTTTVVPIATSATKTTQSIIITTTSTKNTLTETTVSTVKKVNIEYSATNSTKIGNNTPKSGYTYLIVKYKVENSGYFNFYVGPENLKVTVKSNHLRLRCCCSKYRREFLY